MKTLAIVAQWWAASVAVTAWAWWPHVDTFTTERGSFGWWCIAELIIATVAIAMTTTALADGKLKK